MIPPASPNADGFGFDFRSKLVPTSCPTVSDSTANLCSSQLSRTGTLQLLDELNENISSPTLDACRGSLELDLEFLMREANILMEQQQENKHADNASSPWTAVMAQSRAKSYLDTIQSALKDRALLDNPLGSLLVSIEEQLRNRSEAKHDDDAGLFVPARVSSWRTPSLCFDLQMSQPVQCVRTEYMPLKIRAQAICEVNASDLMSTTTRASATHNLSYQACRVLIEECKHEECQFSHFGTLFSKAKGEALVKIRLGAVGDEGTKPSPTWGVDKPVGGIKVNEVRVLQTNAYPPLPKRTVDLFTSSVHGTQDMVVMLRFKTHECLNDDPAEVNIELVMCSS